MCLSLQRFVLVGWVTRILSHLACENHAPPVLKFYLRSCLSVDLA